MPPAMLATAAIGSRTDCSKSRWFRAPATNAFWPFLAQVPLSANSQLSTGGRAQPRQWRRDSALSFLSRAAFEEFAQKHPEVYKSLVRLLATRLRETDNVVAAGSFLPLRGRVAYTLLELAKHFGQDVGSGRVLIRQKIGQSDLAAMTGIVRETINRILNDWRRRRVVSRLTGYYCLENRAVLQKEADTLDDGICGARLSRVRLADASFARIVQSLATRESGRF